MAKIVLLGVSLRRESYNKKLAQNALRILSAQAKGHECELLQFNDYPMSVYNADDEAEKGLPVEVKNLAEKFRSSDGIIFSTPEYNAGIPGAFKNALDWVSRSQPIPWSGKQILLLGASPGGFGAIRGLWHSRVPLEAYGGFVFPEMFGLAKAHEAFDDQGKLKDPKQEQNITTILSKFSQHLELVNRR